jgi:putative ABC transport system permease protein
VEGEYLTNNRQIMLGRRIADSLHLGLGDSITVGSSRFRIVGIFESSVGWEELGGVISLRDAQSMAERPGKVTLFMVDLQNPAQAQVMVAKLNALFPEVYASLGGEFAENLDEIKNTNAMLGAISVMAVLVGGIGMMNTMLMAVLERTREIGVMRALGWRRRQILGLILNEALLLGVLGGAMGIAIAFGFSWLLTKIPYGDALEPMWTADVFGRALLVALSLGVVAGLYPALRATRLQPIEALRYE